MLGLKAARQKQGFTQAEVADKLHVAKNTVYRWEAGIMQPPMDMVIALANLYESSVDELIHPPNPQSPPG